MSETPLPADLPVGLDAVHRAVREAFQRRDLDAYLAHFATDLHYRDAKGRILTRDELGRSVKAQMDRLVAFDSAFERESLEATDRGAVETGAQTASISLRWLFVFALRWTVRRRGRYTWRRRGAGDWELCRVELQEESVRRDGVGLAAHAERTRSA